MAITAAPYVNPASPGLSPLSQGVGTVPGLQIVDVVSTSIARFFQPHGFVYDKVVVPIQTPYNAGEYPVFNTADLFKGAGANLNVPDKAQTPLIELTYDLDTYLTKDYRLAAEITRKEMVQAHPALHLEYVKTQDLLTRFCLNKEFRLAQLLLPTNLGGSLTQVAAIAPTGATWDSGTSASPANIQSDVQAAMLTVLRQTGYRPNTLVIDLELAMAIGNDFTLKDQIKFRIGPEAVAQGYNAVLPATLFGLNVVIADGALYQGGRPEGLNTVAGSGDPLNLSSVWGNYARVAYIDPSAQWGKPSTVYAIRGRIDEGAGTSQPPAPIIETVATGQEPAGVGNQSIMVDRFYQNDPPSQFIRVWENVVEKLVAPDMAVCIGPCLTTSF